MELVEIKNIISIQGNIGAGKTTLFNLLTNEINENKALGVGNIICCKEPVDKWEEKDFNGKSILDLFYENKKEHGFKFQINAFATRIEEYIESTKKSISQEKSRNNIDILSERSMRSDILFLEVLYENKDVTIEEWLVYNKFFNIICKELLKKEKIMIYLDVPAEICYERIRKRKRGLELKITLEYLKNLEIAHEKMLNKFENEGGKVIRLKWPNMDNNEIKIEMKKIKDIIYNI